jgi:hypothetical protein
MAGTKEDAHLMIDLARLGTQMVHPEARGWIWSDSFVGDPEEFWQKHPPGSREFDYVSGMAAWYETVATVWKHGLLDEELLFDWLFVAGPWERLGPILVSMRESTPHMWENFEALAAKQAAHFAAEG